MNILIFAQAIHTNTLSGGDKIFVECAKRWMSQGHGVRIVTNEAGALYCKKSGVAGSHVIVWPSSSVDGLGFAIAVALKAFISLWYSLTHRFGDPDVVFASSFFLPDVLPAVRAKITSPKAHLVTASYIFTQKPWGADYSGGKLKGFFFFINELVSLFIVERFGSLAITASPHDRKRFIEIKNFNERRVMAIRGGVDNAFFSSVGPQPVQYDAVFVGRFHPQKCVDELIDIWETVVKKDPTRKLALIGGGIQDSVLRDLVQKKNLERNIIFLGVKDGVEKAKILKSSCMFVSASRYDTGNIALDEGLACGIPGVVYDLPHLDYPKGVIKIPTGSANDFAQAIEGLLDDEKKRQTLGTQARAFARTIDWDNKAKQLLQFITNEGR